MHGPLESIHYKELKQSNSQNMYRIIKSQREFQKNDAFFAFSVYILKSWSSYIFIHFIQ